MNMNMYNSADDFDLYVTYPHLNIDKNLHKSITGPSQLTT